MLLLVTFITLPYATPWQAVALWYAMFRYDMLYYVTVICAVFLRVVDWNRSDATVIFRTVTVWFVQSDSPNKVCIHPLSLVSFLNEWKCLDIAPIIPGTPAIVSSIMIRLRVEQIKTDCTSLSFRGQCVHGRFLKILTVFQDKNLCKTDTVIVWGIQFSHLKSLP